MQQRRGVNIHIVLAPPLIGEFQPNRLLGTGVRSGSSIVLQML